MKEQRGRLFNIPDSVMNSNLTPSGPNPETVDDPASYIKELTFKCEHCGEENKQEVNIACGFNSELVKIAMAK